MQADREQTGMLITKLCTPFMDEVYDITPMCSKAEGRTFKHQAPDLHTAIGVLVSISVSDSF